MNCCVVIPIYKPNLRKDETHSLRRCLKILPEYDIFFVTFNDLDTHCYDDIIKQSKAQCRYKYFEKESAVKKTVWSIKR